MIEPGIYKNLTVALAHVNDGTFSEYLAEVLGEGYNTAATVTDSEVERPYANTVEDDSDVEQQAPPSTQARGNKGKGVAGPSYSLPKPQVPLFTLSSSDDEDGQDSADEFFLDSRKAAASQQTSLPARQSKRLADKVCRPFPCRLSL